MSPWREEEAEYYNKYVEKELAEKLRAKQEGYYQSLTKVTRYYSTATGYYPPVTPVTEAKSWPTTGAANQLVEVKFKTAENLVEIKKKFWYFQTVVQCPVCERKKITRERREGEKPEDLDECKKLILRFCECSYK